MKLLASEIQSLFTATAHIHCYRRAIEELVFNALDAKATSVAIRIDIQGEKIQVIDNGTGVRKADMSLIGLKHMTSKTIDTNSLQFAPNSYGYKGQALASIIGVTKTVKITSRVEGTSDTFVKIFYKGKEKDFSSAVVRASKGTTIEILGFLYNLKIQKASINSLQEIQEIKQFLERLSLVHRGVSISLRDDTKNEIIFKIHKSRDLFQTIKCLFGIDRKQVQELKVEKNEYKLTAFIGKKVNDGNEVHWIFLNGRLLSSSKLNETVDRNMEKALCLRKGELNKKAAGKITEESNIYKNRIPFYLIFLSCPYNDYDINFDEKQAYIEFRNWEQIQGLIEKLVKFYLGDTSLKLNKVEETEHHNNVNNNTKGEVKKIVAKFLASNSKKLGISQTRNGLKGKLIKRNKNKSPTLSKMPSKYKKTSKAEVDKMIHNIIKCAANTGTDPSVAVNSNCNSVATKVLAHQDSTNKTNIIKTQLNELAPKQKLKKPFTDNPKLKCKILAKKTNGKECQKELINPKNIMTLNKQKIKNKNKLLKVFNKNDCKIRKRCNFLSEKAKRVMKDKPKQATKFAPKKQILFSQAVKYTHFNGRHSVSTKKTIQKTCNEKFESKVKINKQTECYSKDKQLKDKSLLQENDPVTRSNIFCKPINKVNQSKKKSADQNNTQLSGLTFQSHKYELCDYVSHDYCKQGTKKTSDHDVANTHFITTESRDNFDVKNHNENIFIHKSKFKINSKHCYSKKRSFDRRILNIQQDTSYTIEFTTTMEGGDNVNAYGKLKDFNRRNYSIDDNDMDQSQIVKQDDTKPYFKDTFKRNVDISNSSQNIPNNSKFEDYNCISYKRKRFDINNYNQSDSNITQNNADAAGCNNLYSLNQTYDVVGSEKLDNVLVSSYTKNKETVLDKRRMNVLFLSNTQDSENSIELDPLNFCETLLGHTHSPKDDNNKVNLTDALLRKKSKEIKIPNELLCDSTTVINLINAIESEDKNKCLPKLKGETSHHFQKHSNDDGQATYPNFDLDEILNNLNDNIDQTSRINESTTKTFLKSGEEYKLQKETGMAIRKKPDVVIESNFHFKNRPIFLPKGLSPIYANCYAKKQCEFNNEEEYFNNTMYDEFAQNVEMNIEHFKPEVQNVHEMATKDIEKVNSRIQKDNASLCFDGSDLRDAKILGQVDNKFIAAKLRTKTSGRIEHLVLFDQHAVHERIRLENNLNEYLKGNQWKSVKLDEMVLKLNPGDILYLHNYRDKFCQLGLNWYNTSDREVCISAIPEAILGKNPRQAKFGAPENDAVHANAQCVLMWMKRKRFVWIVAGGKSWSLPTPLVYFRFCTLLYARMTNVDIIMKAVKSLILEEIESLKLQKGSLKLYPKAIMDLVFSEACRYAIKFGDPLSKDECIKLIKDLCKCKSPFQCAHGRPVMAVVMDIKPLAVSYKV